MIVQACLNGDRRPGSHPRLPTDPAGLAADAAAVVQAGAHEIHLHVRSPDGRESLAPADVDATMAAIRAAIPGTLVGISTGTWIERDDDRRLAYMATWRELPDYASVNLSEPGAPAVIERLRRIGIGIEAGFASAADAERLIRLDLARLSLRILIEINEQDLAEAKAVTDAILAVLAGARVSLFCCMASTPRSGPSLRTHLPEASPPGSASKTGPTAGCYGHCRQRRTGRGGLQFPAPAAQLGPVAPPSRSTGPQRCPSTPYASSWPISRPAVPWSGSAAGLSSAGDHRDPYPAARRQGPGRAVRERRGLFDARLTNLFGTVERVAWGMNREPHQLQELGETLAFFKQPVPPESFGQALELLPLVKVALSMSPSSSAVPPARRSC